MLYIFWITRDCNLRCDYCYLEKNKEYMSSDIAVKAVDFAVKKLKEECSLNEMHNIILHGGEPTLNFNIIKEIVNKFKENKDIYSNLKFNMTTNGTIVTDEMITFIKENKISLSVSIDGQKSEHDRHRKFKNGDGSYSIIMNNLLKYRKEGIQIRIRMTITPETINNLYENFKFFYESGFKSIPYILDMYNNNWTKSDMKAYFENSEHILEFLKNRDVNSYISHLVNLRNSIHRLKGVCSGGINEFNINCNGDIYPCSFAIGDEDYKIGNILIGTDMNRIERLHNINKVTNKCCEGCGFSLICDGARCKILNKKVTGDYYKPNALNCYENNVKKKLVEKCKIDIEKYNNYIVEFDKYLEEKMRVRMI